ncbi:accessory factor UbiK family protein, partial [Escherichia coli]|uniref:accessory factor UbiK family protein n=1 Tax=Escherichia coli TaxID=562 RepID=UPI0010CB153F
MYEALLSRLQNTRPNGFRDSGEVVDKQLAQTRQPRLPRLALGSREAFDVRTHVLLRTREKLALLEHRISELEARNNSVADLQSPPAIPPIDK